jgi:hypothetical protein
MFPKDWKGSNRVCLLPNIGIWITSWGCRIESKEFISLRGPYWGITPVDCYGLLRLLVCKTSAWFCLAIYCSHRTEREAIG